MYTRRKSRCNWYFQLKNQDIVKIKFFILHRSPVQRISAVVQEIRSVAFKRTYIGQRGTGTICSAVLAGKGLLQEISISGLFRAVVTVRPLGSRIVTFAVLLPWIRFGF